MTAGAGRASSPPLVLEGVTKSFHRGVHGRGAEVVHALRDVDLVVEEGSAVGVIGPNGAGKTTLLRLAMGVSSPDRGRIVRRDRTAGVIELGMGLHPELTGRENLAFAGALVGLTGRRLEARTDEIVAFSGIEDHLDRVVKHYSSGMQARLSFSIAAHAGAELVLLDEVLSVGDQEFRQRSLERLRALHAEGTTLVLVTHDLAMMSVLCERALLIDQGSVLDDGPASQVAARYLGQDRAGPSAVGEVRIRPVADVVAAGEPFELDVEVEVTHEWRSLEARVLLGIPQGDPGADASEVPAYASAIAPVAWQGRGRYGFRVAVDTRYLPVSSYLVTVVVGVGSGIDPARASIPVRVRTSTAQRLGMRLPAAVEVVERGGRA